MNNIQSDLGSNKNEKNLRCFLVSIEVQSQAFAAVLR